jgi:hypothetical protein
MIMLRITTNGGGATFSDSGEIAGRNLIATLRDLNLHKSDIEQTRKNLVLAEGHIELLVSLGDITEADGDKLIDKILDVREAL